MVNPGAFLLPSYAYAKPKPLDRYQAFRTAAKGKVGRPFPMP